MPLAAGYIPLFDDFFVQPTRRYSKSPFKCVQGLLSIMEVNLLLFSVGAERFKTASNLFLVAVDNYT